jgi:CheY-like chemotaxis protein
MGFADLMVQSDVAPAQIERYVAVIRRNSSQLLRIIDDILDLSKVEAGKMVIERVPFSLIELLDDVSTMLGLRARESSIAYSMHLQPPFPESVISDPTRLRQILMNVIGNAIKFTHRGSVTFIASYAAGVLSFEVKDTGHGISTEQSQFLFKPFAQADTSTTRKFGGTGLGLVLTRKLCEAMGGTFYLKESALGVGSTFVAQVKAEAVKTKRMIELDYRPHAHLMGSEELRGADVLLVEDSTDNQELIRILLTNAGAKVEIAGNGRIGVQKALAHPYSVILMDVQMPEMDGVEALSIMRKHGVEVPIIALTAHAMKIERDRCLRAGFSEFLSKPVNRDDLVRQILATS